MGIDLGSSAGCRIIREIRFCKCTLYDLVKSDYNDNFSQSIKDVLSALDLANKFSEMLDQRQAFIGGEWKDANSG